MTNPYVTSIGGDAINPNPFYYSQIEMTASIALGWPSNMQSSTYTATNWIDITANNTGYIATMPDATQVGTGQECVFNNYGSNTITVNNSAGGTITTVASGEAKRIWLTDTSTAAGTWRIANIGSGTTSADASMLAGYGLIAQAGQLSQSMPPINYSTDQPLSSGVRSYAVIWTGGAGTLTLDDPATLGANWFVNIKNSGSGILNIDGNGADIDGIPDIDVGLNEGFTIVCDGAQFYTLGRLTPDTTNITLLNKSVAGATDVTLTSAEAAYNIINFTGALTGNINVIVPTAVNEWIFYNATSGAFTLTVKTAAGTGIAITQSTRTILYCDGTNVERAQNTTSGTVTSITAGTGLTGGTITTTGTIALDNTSVVAGTYGSSTAYPILVVNAQGQVTGVTLSNWSAVAALLASANIFTATQTIQSSDSGAAEGPEMALYRASSSPAANDLIGVLTFVGKDSGANATRYASVYSQILDPTDGSEDSRLGFQNYVAGSSSTKFYIGGGLYSSSATGGDKGADTINANSLYIAGNQLIAATQTDQEAGTSSTIFVSPARQQYHPSAPKAWCRFTSTTGAIVSSYNVTSVTRNSAGNYTVLLTTAFSNTNYFVNVVVGKAVTVSRLDNVSFGGNNTFTITVSNDGGTPLDPQYIGFEAYGDQ